MSCKLLTHPSISTSELSILFWQGLVDHLLPMPSQSSHHMGFCSISLFRFIIYSIIFLLWFSLEEVNGLLKLLGCPMQVSSPQTRDDQAIEQSLWQIPWQINYFCACYVTTDLLSNFNFDIAFSHCWINIEKLMSLFQSVCIHRKNHC